MEDEREERERKRGKGKRRKKEEEAVLVDVGIHRNPVTITHCHTVSPPPSDRHPLVVTLFWVGGSGGERLSISAYRQLHVCGCLDGSKNRSTYLRY
jgi:hypothetical protein